MSKPKIKIVREWVDDHILCCEVKVGEEIIELLWCGWEGLAAAKYAGDSIKALRDLRGTVQQQIDLIADGQLTGIDGLDDDEVKRLVLRRVLAKLEAM